MDADKGPEFCMLLGAHYWKCPGCRYEQRKRKDRKCRHCGKPLYKWGEFIILEDGGWVWHWQYKWIPVEISTKGKEFIEAYLLEKLKKPNKKVKNKGGGNAT